MSSGWDGLEAVCVCLPRYFGEDCSKMVAPRTFTEKIIGAKGGAVSVEGGKYAGGNICVKCVSYI